MTEELRRLVEASRNVRITAEERERQRRSFAYGNTSFENPRITRKMVDAEAEKLASQPDDER